MIEVNVAVSKHNRKRVTIDVGQASKKGAGAARPVPGARMPAPRDFTASGAGGSRDLAPFGQGLSSSADIQRLTALAQLGQLHRQGVLTDAEFEAQKARILAE